MQIVPADSMRRAYVSLSRGATERSMAVSHPMGAMNRPRSLSRVREMNIVWSILIIAGACSVAIAAMLFVRRRAPEGGFFEDGDRAAGVFGVLATGFSVLLGFIVFLAFESYD